MLIKERDPDTLDLTVSLGQLKKIYLALFRQLHQSGPATFDAWDEDDMLMTLQNYLQRRARLAGVDGTNHAEWDAFLGATDSPSCERRFRSRGGERQE